MAGIMNKTINIAEIIQRKGIVTQFQPIISVRQKALDYSLRPGNIIIKIVESEAKNLSALTQFVQNYKNLGCLIALDDFGAGYSNLDRVAVIRPDIIKIDRLLIQDINQEYYKQEIVKSLVGLAHKLGALALAEGVENEKEALVTLELGADMLQGYYFSKPVSISEVCIERYQSLIDRIGTDFRTALVQKRREQKVQRGKLNIMVNGFTAALSETNESDFDEKILEFLNSHSSLECIYVLDEWGLQISDTIYDPTKFSEEKRTIFSPARKGADQSLKEYYWMIDADMKVIITEPYISMASGNRCVTISALFNNIQDNKYILCLDVQAS